MRPPVYVDPDLAPIIDARVPEDLVIQACERIRVASGGKINDFSIHSPVRALVEGQVFAQSELLFFLNLVPRSLALHWLNIAGITRRMASKSVGAITIETTTPVTNFRINQGTKLSGGGNLYQTTRDLVINGTTGQVDIESLEYGYSQNVKVSVVNNFVSPISFIKTVYNHVDVVGGRDEETDAELEVRGFLAIRRRSLTTATDYVEETVEILGRGYRAWVITGIAEDLYTKEPGVIHVIAASQDGEVSLAALESLRIKLQSRTQLGMKVVTSTAKPMRVTITVSGVNKSGLSGAELSDRLYESLRSYISTLSLGDTVRLKSLEAVASNYLDVFSLDITDEVNTPISDGIQETNSIPDYPRFGGDLPVKINEFPMLVGMELRIQNKSISNRIGYENNSYSTYFSGGAGIDYD